jgi:hypothetical protein
MAPNYSFKQTRSMDVTDLVTQNNATHYVPRGSTPHTAPWDHEVCVMLHAAQGIVDNGGFEYFFEAPFEGRPALEDFQKRLRPSVRTYQRRPCGRLSTVPNIAVCHLR